MSFVSVITTRCGVCQPPFLTIYLREAVGWTTFFYSKLMLVCYRSVHYDISNWFQVFKGSVKVGESDEVIPTFHTVVLSNAEGETGVRLTAAEDNTELVLVRIIVP